MKEPSNKEYIFNCGYKDGEHHCNGVHSVILNDEIYAHLFNRLDLVYNFDINEEFFEKHIKEFEEFVIKKHTLLKELSHFDYNYVLFLSGHH